MAFVPKETSFQDFQSAVVFTNARRDSEGQRSTTEGSQQARHSPPISHPAVDLSEKIEPRIEDPSEATERGTLRPPFNPSHERNEVSLRLLADKLAELSNISKAMAEQLSEAKETAQLSYTMVIGLLSDINAKGQSLLQLLNEQRQIAQTISEKIAERMKKNNDTIAGLLRYVERRRSQVSKDVQSIEGVLRRIDDLKDLVDGIHDLADRTSILALNARIEAMRAGTAGQTFAVVATHVRKLSEQTQQAAKQIERTISRLLHEAHQNLSTVASEILSSEEESNYIQSLAREIEEINSALSEVNDFLLTTFERSSVLSDDICSDIVDALGKMQRQDLSRQQIEFASSRLEAFARMIDRIRDAVDEHMSRLASDLHASWLPGVFAEHIGAFVEMDVARPNAVVGADDGSTSHSLPTIELF